MILFLFLFASSLFAETLSHHDLGVITQLKGVVTFFPYEGIREVTPMMNKSSLREGGSYLSHEKSYFTVKLFDGSYLKVSPNSKFSLELKPEEKEIHLSLFSGSVKVLFSGGTPNAKMQKFIITSGDGRYETSAAKFSVFRNILESTGYVYVEKGLVRVARNQSDSGNELVHGQEMSSLKDRDSTIENPRKISENQMKFLNSAFYLGNTKSFE